MVRVYKDGRDHDEAGLSEVIGFILLIFLVMAAFSIYLVYSVPAQGRDNEISHMNTVKDEFIGYKIGVDSLWTNNLINSGISSSFQLGTQGQTTQGNNGFLPMLQPIASMGTISITPRSEIFTVTSYVLYDNGTPQVNQTIAPGYFQINTTPNSLIVNITDSSIGFLYPVKRSVVVNGSNWWANVTVNPRFFNNVQTVQNYSATDITIDVNKNGIMAMQGFTVYTGIQPNTNYSVNLFDDAYGLKNLQTYPEKVSFSLSPAATQTGYGIISYPNAYDPKKPTSYPPVTLGAIQYNVNNNYWLNQTFYYQDGGVFLQQPDGTSSILPPAVTFSLNGSSDTVGVSVVELPYVSPLGSLGGSGSASVSTQVNDIGQLSASQLQNNARWVNISIGQTDQLTAEAWYQVLDFAANSTGHLPRSFYTAGNSSTGAFINVTGDPAGPSFGIGFAGKRVNLSASVQGG